MAENDYSPPGGTAAGNQYFQDVEVGPATVASGALLQRLDPKRYPSLGRDMGAQAGGATPTVTVTASNNAPAVNAAVDLTAHVSGPALGRKPKGQVVFKDGVTQLGSAALSDGQATLHVGGGFAAGVHHIIAVYAGDGLFDTGTSAAHDVTAA